MSSTGIKLYLCRESPERSHEQLLRETASSYAGEDASNWVCVREEGGKPCFTERPDVCFSISHSDGYWGCAFAAQALGFDLQLREDRHIEKISRRFFHPDEDKWLSERGYRQEDFYELWTAKESYIKFTGKGLPGGLDNFSVLNAKVLGVEFKHLPAPEGYSLCLCAAEIGEVEVIYM